MSRHPVISTATPATLTGSEAWLLSEEPQLSAELAERFGHWLEGELDQLQVRFAGFVTPESAHKSLFQTRSTSI